MSRIGVNAQVLSRCGSSWMGTAVAPVRIATPLCYNIRQISTTRPKEAQSTTKKAAKGAGAPATKAKKTSSKVAAAASEQATKATKAAKPAKKTQASKSPDAATSGKEAKTVAPSKQKTRVVDSATASPTTGAPEPAASAATTTTQAAAAAGATPAYSASSSHRDPRQVVQPTADGGAKTKADPSGPEYKRAARNWTSTMIALPILIVTSYFLFERLVVGKNPSLEPFRAQPQPVLPAEGTKAGDA